MTSVSPSDPLIVWTFSLFLTFCNLPISLPSVSLSHPASVICCDLARYEAGLVQELGLVQDGSL